MNIDIISSRPKAEVLAPAGSFEAFKAVINAGADAVYLGGDMFGARAYAGNLSKEEVLEAIEYAHIHNRRLYLTVNTLLKNTELTGKLYNYILPFYEAGLDAVIVQDYGVMKFINDNFPKLDIHASTQMTVTDVNYIDFLKQYNVTRIVPARELSFSDIRKLHEYTDMEIECFVHGALCYCYSGLCLMSSFIGGRSGNRGRCAQPCRLDYSYKGNEKALLSLKDLCTIEILPQVIESGVYSLKIEGRMKKPEYAAGVTSIYRKYVDMYLESGADKYKADSRDIDRLLMLFDRGGLIKGYYVKHNGADMIANPQKASKSLDDKKNFENGIKEQFIDKDIKEKVNIYVKLLKNNNATMTFIDSEGITVTVTGQMVEMAQNKAMSKDDILKQITKLGATYFEADNVEIEMEDDIFIPNKALNELRREAVGILIDEKLKKYRRNVSDGELNYSYSSQKFQTRTCVRVMTKEQAKAVLKFKIARVCLESELMTEEDMREIINKCHASGVECYLGLPRIFKEGCVKLLQGFDGYYVRNMAEFYWLRKNNAVGKIIADYSVYAFNNLAAKVLADAGYDGVTLPVELNSSELAHLEMMDMETELIVYGRIPVMITANCVNRTVGSCNNKCGISYITDRKKAKLLNVSSCKFCYSVIYNNVPECIYDKETDINKISPAYISISFTDETAKMTEDIMMDVDNRRGLVAVKEYTRGHFTRGVE